MRRRISTCLWFLMLAGAMPAAGASEEARARGEYLATAAGCASCHTDSENDGVAYAGGHRLETPFGDFYTPNITPDAATGIGGWSWEQFDAAVRAGVSPDGSHYYPAFPYPSYAGITADDTRDLKVYFDSLAAVSNVTPDNALAWYVPGRWAMRIWQSLFAPWDYAPAPEQTVEWQRGAYLVRHLGHCGECHTPRDQFGALDTSRELAGNKAEIGGAPDIRAATGLANWSADDLELFLEIGLYPDGDFVGGSMTAVIDDNMAQLTPADRSAIVAFLLDAAAPELLHEPN